MINKIQTKIFLVTGYCCGGASWDSQHSNFIFGSYATRALAKKRLQEVKKWDEDEFREIYDLKILPININKSVIKGY